MVALYSSMLACDLAAALAWRPCCTAPSTLKAPDVSARPAAPAVAALAPAAEPMAAKKGITKAMGYLTKE